MSLKDRIAAFEPMARRFPCERPAKLIAAHPIREDLWQGLRFAAAVYMSRCLPGDRVLLDERELLSAFEKELSRIPNITPNGMIVPKRHTILEYNLLVRAFARIIDAMGIEPHISSWHVPLNLRIKFADVNQENMKRHHPTEHIHSDSWAGESAESVTTHLPIFGDTDRNRVVFYDAPPEFEESWLGPRPTYQDGAEVAARYRKLGFVPRKGTIVLADFSTLHASTRFPGCGSRVTIDTTFHLKRPSKPGVKEIIHPWRVGERAPHAILSRLGETHLFVFPDDATRKVDSQGGFKHPTNLQIVEILRDEAPAAAKVRAVGAPARRPRRKA